MLLYFNPDSLHSVSENTSKCKVSTCQNVTTLLGREVKNSTMCKNNKKLVEFNGIKENYILLSGILMG